MHNGINHLATIHNSIFPSFHGGFSSLSACSILQSSCQQHAAFPTPSRGRVHPAVGQPAVDDGVVRYRAHPLRRPSRMVTEGSGLMITVLVLELPSGKHTKNYGKSPFFMGRRTVSTGPFSIAMLNYQRVRMITIKQFL